MRFTLILALASAPLAAFACNDSGTLAIKDALVDAGPDAALVCGPSGVSKGPWVLGATLTGAKIRWEACRAGVAVGLTLTPESGGAAQKATSVETAFATAETYTAPLQPMATPSPASAAPIT